MSTSRPPLIQDVRVRPVEASDIGDLIRLGEAGNLSPWTADHYLAEMRSRDSVLLRLVSNDNVMLGFVVGRLVVSIIETALDAEIYNIMVDEPVRRSGLGQLLLDNFLERCRARGVASVWLEVRESNSQAISFYSRNNFVCMQSRPNFYRDPVENALLMRLALSPK